MYFIPVIPRTVVVVMAVLEIVKALVDVLGQSKEKIK